MKLGEARVALRHRPVLEVLDLALRFLLAHAAPYAATTAFVVVPLGVLSLVIAMQAGWIWGWASAIALATVARIPFTVLASRLVFEADVAFEQVLGAAARASFKVLVARALELVALTVGFGVFFLPAIWIASVFVYLDEILVLERASIWGAFARSQRLVAGELGDAFLVAVLLAGLHFGATALGDKALRALLGDVLQISPPPSMWERDGGVLGLVAFWLFVPYSATARLLAYLNVRTKAEGWDVQTRFAAIAARLAPAADREEAA